MQMQVHFNGASARKRATERLVMRQAGHAGSNTCALGVHECLTLLDAIKGFTKTGLTPSLIAALRVQLAGKWKYAATAYRASHPGVLPLEKSAPGCPPTTLLLPVQDAQEKMMLWVPWGIEQILRQALALQVALRPLTVEQRAAVDAEPEANVMENEEV